MVNSKNFICLNWTMANRRIIRSTIQWNFMIIFVNVIFCLKFANPYFIYILSTFYVLFVFALLRLILICFSAEPKKSLLPCVGPSPDSKKIFFFWLLVWDDKLLSTQKITTFLAKLLLKLLEPSQSNAIPWLLKVNFLFIEFLTKLSWLC